MDQLSAAHQKAARRLRDTIRNELRKPYFTELDGTDFALGIHPGHVTFGKFFVMGDHLTVSLRRWLVYDPEPSLEGLYMLLRVNADGGPPHFSIDEDGHICVEYTVLADPIEAQAIILCAVKIEQIDDAMGDELLATFHGKRRLMGGGGP